jgi:hypothetical protein
VTLAHHGFPGLEAARPGHRIALVHADGEAALLAATVREAGRSDWVCLRV